MLKEFRIGREPSCPGRRGDASLRRGYMNCALKVGESWIYRDGGYDGKSILVRLPARTKAGTTAEVCFILNDSTINLLR